MRYRSFCDELRLKIPNYTVPDEIKIIFHVPMPPSWSLKHQTSMIGKPHQQRPDIDNYLKAYLDALCTEDSHVWNAHAIKLWSRVGAIEICTVKSD